MKKVFVLYSALICLPVEGQAQPLQRTIKENLTAPELAILAAIHGPDSIHPKHLVATGDVEMEERVLRQQLVDAYNTQNTNGAEILKEMFGAMGSLPTHVEDAVPGLATTLGVDAADIESIEAAKEKMGIGLRSPPPEGGDGEEPTDGQEGGIFDQ